MPRKDCWRSIVVCLVIGLGTVALYSPAFHFGFVNFDDRVYVTSNGPVNHGLTAAGVHWAFSSFYAGNWHPVTWLSHMVDCQVFGPKAGGHHATSIVLHALTSVLLFLALRSMTGAFWRSAAVAAFFAWHPLQVEPVAWIADRKDVLSGFFWMLALWAYVRYAQNSKAQLRSSKFFYALALLFFAVGLMAKPMLVTLPCVLLLLDWWPLGRLRFGAAPQEEGKPTDIPRPLPILVEKIPFFLLSIASCVMTVIAARHQTVTSMVALMGVRKRLVMAMVAYFHYIEKVVWPSDLGPAYPFLVHRPKWELAGIALVLAAMMWLAIRFRNSRPYWLVGWLWFVGMLVPTLNIPYVASQPMADHYMYLPLIGLLILVCWDACDLGSQWAAGRVVTGIVCILALAGCCLATSLQLRFWKDEGALASRIAQPEANFMGHANYAEYLMSHNQLPAAEAECEKAVSIVPAYAPYQAMLGEILLLEHKNEDAIQKFRAVQRLDANMIGIHLLWGRALLAEKRNDEAAAEFKTVINAEPKAFEAHNLLAETYATSGKTAAAVQEFRRSVELQPKQPDALNDMAWLLATDPSAEVRNGADAVKFAAQACGMTRGSQPFFLGTLAAAYAEAGRFDDAVDTAQRAHDIAMAQAGTAEKASQPVAARNWKAVAAHELELLDLYRSHKPFHEKAR